ncbi:MAG: hypothetical protein Q7O66_08855 [Dehalococcoidia bacterium]|nr:hypothetical protein [Dehalococcoidia bacterium]
MASCADSAPEIRTPPGVGLIPAVSSSEIRVVHARLDIGIDANNIATVISEYVLAGTGGRVVSSDLLLLVPSTEFVTLQLNGKPVTLAPAASGAVPAEWLAPSKLIDRAIARATSRRQCTPARWQRTRFGSSRSLSQRGAASPSLHSLAWRWATI